jgi:hypothetical protein
LKHFGEGGKAIRYPSYIRHWYTAILYIFGGIDLCIKIFCTIDRFLTSKKNFSSSTIFCTRYPHNIPIDNVDELQDKIRLPHTRLYYPHDTTYYYLLFYYYIIIINYIIYYVLLFIIISLESPSIGIFFFIPLKTDQ